MVLPFAAGCHVQDLRDVFRQSPLLCPSPGPVRAGDSEKLVKAQAVLYLLRRTRLSVVVGLAQEDDFLLR